MKYGKILGIGMVLLSSMFFGACDNGNSAGVLIGTFNVNKYHNSHFKLSRYDSRRLDASPGGYVEFRFSRKFVEKKY
jgi:hypothetical protein